METIQSLNTTVDLVTPGTSYLGLGSYGDLLIGDRGFEFYADKNRQNYIQIPWQEIDYVSASVFFKGRWIPRFTIHTQKNGDFSFAARQVREVLRAINQYIPTERMRHSLSAWDVIKRSIQNKLNR